MAHALDMTRGVAAMSYVRSEGMPWHTLGTAVENAQTWEECSKNSHLDWPMELYPLKFPVDFNGQSFNVDSGKQAVMRMDAKAPAPTMLGIVSERYKIVQNDEAFAFLDGLVSGGELRYHTAGALDGGRRIWLMGKLKKEMVIADDLIDKYIVLSNANDGTEALRVVTTGVRVVCANTLAMAMHESKGCVSIRHKGEITDKMEEARQVLKLVTKDYDLYEEKANLLASRQYSAKSLDNYLKALYPDPERKKVVEGEAEARVRQQAAKTRATIAQFAETGPGNDNPKVKGTLWALYNGVTQYLTHVSGNKSVLQSKKLEHADDKQARLEKRTESLWFGKDAKMNAQAMEYAVSIAKTGKVPNKKKAMATTQG